MNDGTIDCDDGSDEPPYDLDDLSSFTCDDGTVVGISNVNNGVLTVRTEPMSNRVM